MTNTTDTDPRFSSPELPRDRLTMNAWNRYFYDTNPVVKRGISFHAISSVSNFKIIYGDSKIEQFFSDMVERLNLFNIITNIALEYYKMGEAFVYAELDKPNATWKSIILHNPDYMNVKMGKSGATIISMRPSELLKKSVSSKDPQDVELRSQMPENVRRCVENNEPIPMDDFNITHFKMLSTPYDVRGTSHIVSCYKDLLLYDKLIQTIDGSVPSTDTLNFIRENLCIGLMIPKSVLDRNEYNYVPTNLYTTFHNMIEQWLNNKIFMPISQLQGFHKLVNGKNVPIIPEISWK